MRSETDAYRRKRDPARTPEPFAPGAAGERPRFVVQRHAARRLHYDFRLERHGVLASWAVPKGIPLEPGSKALAVHVEDHPLSYAAFAGEIPAGQYGAGTVEIWDSGSYELLAEKADGELTVQLEGRRLRGRWTLVPAGLDGKEANWLLIRRRDGAAAPAVYRPMLATPVKELPRGGSWLYEAKLDGYRALASVAGGSCELHSRNGNDLSGRFPDLTRAVAAELGAASAVLDGEICALDARGRPSFSALQTGGGQIVYYAFDCLEADGVSLVERPLEERRVRLAELLGVGSASVRLSEAFEDGAALLEAVRAQGLEGVVAKRAGSLYAQGKRNREWLKLKTSQRQEFVVAGFTAGAGARSGSIGSLVLALNEGGALRYAGNVGTGFGELELARLAALLDPLRRSSSPLAAGEALPRARAAEVRWVEPRLVVEVAFAEWTREGRVRHPSYLGLRDDKAPLEVRPERPGEDTVTRGPRSLRLTNLDKVFWAAEGITKGDLVEYYRAVAPALVPHLRRRPFTMRRYPDGIDGKAAARSRQRVAELESAGRSAAAGPATHFFQKDAPSHMPDWIPTFPWETSTRSGLRKLVNFPVVDDELALLWMVNMGCIDMNPWYSRIDRPDRPDFVLFDLDPTPEVPYAHTVEVALILKRLLDDVGLSSFPKTSGGKGFHVLVPIERRSSYDDTRSFAEHVAGVIARAYPTLATTAWSKAQRKGVLIDANQNGMGKTIASVYSVRPHPGAPVSTPLSWEEVNEKLDARAFTMRAVLERLDKHGDLFEGVLKTRQSLSSALHRLR